MIQHTKISIDNETARRVAIDADGRFTPRGAMRLSNLIMYGPQDEKPTDADLIAHGWAQRYEDTDAVEAHPEAEQAFREGNGHGPIKARFMPKQWVKVTA